MGEAKPVAAIDPSLVSAVMAAMQHVDGNSAA